MDSQDVDGKECLEGQIRRNCTAVVSHLLLSGDYDTDSRLFSYFVTRLAGFVTNYPKGNGVGRGHAPYGEKTCCINSR
ncbi:hypothetical protein [Bacillus wiedmannii]|uniref:hypothetical protein n=1 Tax=Bacillus wiedmannii TaxID=1890302 RepID=UPI002FFDC327